MLPPDFIADMQRALGDDEAARLLQALTDTAPVTSIRINTRKWQADSRVLDGMQRVPWCESGYYLDTRPPFTFDPLLHAGAYYVQEASSMFVDHILRQHCPASCMAALDLCAAPGGKSTLLRDILPDETLLVCNEPMPKRAQVLAENMTKWGHPNVMVTQSMPDDFTAMHEAFDLILTDVPCSGEGMFRKDEQAVADWSTANVETCWQRQREILTAIWPALRAGGVLVYSTCTFNRYEDEDNVEWIARELGADVLPVDIQPTWGIQPSATPMWAESPLGYHFYPHRTRGEGFFAAVLRKHGEQGGCDSAFTLQRLQRRLRAATKVIVDGVPQYADLPRHDVDYHTAVQYLQGQVLRLPTDVPHGMVLVTYRGLPLGTVKNIGSRANNLYPQPWRIKSTHIKPYSVESRE